MKRILSLLLCLAMFLTVSGLVLAEGESSSTTDPTGPSGPTEPPVPFEFEVVSSSPVGEYPDGPVEPIGSPAGPW